MSLNAQVPLGDDKTKAADSDYHKAESPAAARRTVVAREYLKRAAKIDELKGHPPGTDGPMATELKRFNVGRVLVFAMGAFADVSEDVSRICDIIADELAIKHVSYYNDDAQRATGMCKQRTQTAWGHTAHRGLARLLLGNR